MQDNFHHIVQPSDSSEPVEYVERIALYREDIDLISQCFSSFFCSLVLFDLHHILKEIAMTHKHVA